MAYLLGKTTVEDFDAWKSAFDGNESFRTDHGERGYQVFQSTADPNEIVVVFEWDDSEDPGAFFRSEAMRERMTDAGVKGQPELTTMELVDRKSTVEPSA